MPKVNNLFQHLSKLKPTKSEKGGPVKEYLEEIMAQWPKQFPFETLVLATNGFDANHKLGAGGFGTVYKGKFDDGREIAVKKHSLSPRQGKNEFVNEAKQLGSVQHRNLVKLLGYCSHGEEMLLVYEYVANGSLDKLLFNSEIGRVDALDWKRTYDIIVGIARGLNYLHKELHNVIIHRDIKPANILIDENWIPKIADFGMAHLLPQDQTDIFIDKVVGTSGYIAPEYIRYGLLSTKADTFSFGVVVLELTSGQNVFSDHVQSLLGKGNELYKKGKRMAFMDPKLASSAVPDQVELCVRIGIMCTHIDPEQRPTMDCVILMLSENHGTTQLEQPMTDQYTSCHASSSSSSSTSRTPGIPLENVGLPKYRRRLDRAARIRSEDVLIYMSSVSRSGNGIQKESEQAPVGAVQEEEVISIPTTVAQPALIKVPEASESSLSRYLLNFDDISGRQAHIIGLGKFQFQTKGKLQLQRRRNTSNKASTSSATSIGHSRKTLPLPAYIITKQTKEAEKEPTSSPEPKKKRKVSSKQRKPLSSLEPTKKRKKVAEQQTMEAAREHPAIIDIEGCPEKGHPEPKVWDKPITMGDQVSSRETAFGIPKAFFLPVDKLFKTTFQSSISMSFQTCHIVYLLIMVASLVLHLRCAQSTQKIILAKERLQKALLEKTRLADEAWAGTDQAERALLAAQKRAAIAEENFVQTITKLESVWKHYEGLEARLKSMNDERNRSCKCEGFQEAKKKYKAQLSNQQDVIFKAGWEVILKKVGVAKDSPHSPFFSKVPLPSLVEPPTTEDAVGDHCGGTANSNG